MIKNIIILIISFSCLIPFKVEADSWIDPEWREMINGSDVIALVEYTYGGDFRAQAEIIKVYKGFTKVNQIWISGFSNRFGPIDTMKQGDRYIVFLNLYKPTSKTLEYWSEKLKKKPELSNYYKALENELAYYVWTPTSGDLQVVKNKVQYDLIQTTFHNKQSFYSLREFEAFLKACNKSSNSKFQKGILRKIKFSVESEKSSQYLMMLYLTSFDKYDEVFMEIANRGIPESCFALAKLLGVIDDVRSRDLLIQMLSIESSIVQGEVVRQLSNENAELIGPILLGFLKSAGEDGVYPSNLMDPVRNSLDGGKLEIIRTLGKINYRPAIELLLPLLDTEEDYLFKLVVDVLNQLNSTAYVPYLNSHLKRRTKSLVLDICDIIVSNNLEACRPALMEFISNHNRNDHPGYEYTISTHLGLAHFDDQETRDFLLNDFENFLVNNDTIESKKIKDWYREYIETFKDLGSEEARPLIYRSLFQWFGYNYDFILHPELFSLKREIEDSLTEEAMILLEKYDVSQVQSTVFINNTSEYADNYHPEYHQIIMVELNKIEIIDDENDIWNMFKAIKKEVSVGLDIPIESISTRSGIYVSNLDDRLDTSIDWSPMAKFYKYATELHSVDDLKFLKLLRANGFAKSDFDQRQLDRAIMEIEINLDKEK